MFLFLKSLIKDYFCSFQAGFSLSPSAKLNVRKIKILRIKSQVMAHDASDILRPCYSITAFVLRK